MTANIESEVARIVLTQRKVLSDNTFGKIFSRGLRNASGSFLYNCQLCRVSGLPGEYTLMKHVLGRKHQQRLSMDYVPNAVSFQEPISSTAFIADQVQKPGFESDLVLGSQVEEALIGVEYVVKLSGTADPIYICTLCDEARSQSNIVPELVSSAHRMKYLVSLAECFF